jgi:hypothetical protein
MTQALLLKLVLFAFTSVFLSLFNHESCRARHENAPCKGFPDGDSEVPPE